ncbi:MAG: hypothetical protein ABSA51_03035 [Anaerolineaceae bacterium]
MSLSEEITANAWWIVPSCIFLLEVVLELAELAIYYVGTRQMLMEHALPIIGKPNTTLILREIEKDRDQRISEIVGQWGQELCLVGLSFTVLALAGVGCQISVDAVPSLFLMIVLYIVTWMISLFIEPYMRRQRFYFKLWGALPIFLGFLAVGFSLTLFSSCQVL